MFEPGRDFDNYEADDKPGVKNKIAFLSSYFSRYRKYFIQIGVGLIAACLVQLVFPFLTQSIVDVGIDYRDKHFIWLILAAQLMLIFGEASISFIRRKLLLYISSHINLSII